MFTPTVERWRSLVREHANGLPVEFLLAWISWESGGLEEALGSAYEVGLFQINMADGPAYGGTIDTLHNNFAPFGVAKKTRPTTDAEKLLQVTTGVNQATHYAELSTSRLHAIGADWPRGSSDFWCLVKLHHGLPALPGSFLSACRNALGRAPSGWSEFRDYLVNISQSDAQRVHAGAAAYWGSKGKKGFQRFTDNAEATGKFGGVELLGGLLSLPLVVLVLLAGALAMATAAQ